MILVIDILIILILLRLVEYIYARSHIHPTLDLPLHYPLLVQQDDQYWLIKLPIQQ